MLAAYDAAGGQPGVDASAIAVVGSSYGGYLAAILTSLRPVRWLGLRVPALYKDEDWDAAEAAARQGRSWPPTAGAPCDPEENRALARLRGVRGRRAVVESEHDDVVPHPAIANYRAAFARGALADLPGDRGRRPRALRAAGSRPTPRCW